MYLYAQIHVFVHVYIYTCVCMNLYMDTRQVRRNYGSVTVTCSQFPAL